MRATSHAPHSTDAGSGGRRHRGRDIQASPAARSSASVGPLVRRRRRRRGQKRRWSKSRRFKEIGCEQRFADAQPIFETGNLASRHRRQCHEAAQIVFRRRHEFAARTEKLGQQFSGHPSCRRVAAPQHEQVPEFQVAVHAGCRHRRLEARLKGFGIRVRENAKTIMLLAVTFIMEGKEQAAMECRYFLIWLALHTGVDMRRQLHMIFEQHQSGQQKTAQAIFPSLFEEAGDIRRCLFGDENMVTLRRQRRSGSRRLPGKRGAFGDRAGRQATLNMLVASAQKLARRHSHDRVEGAMRKRPRRIGGDELLLAISIPQPRRDDSLPTCALSREGNMVGAL